MDLNKFFYDLDELLNKGMSEKAILFVQDSMEEAIRIGDKNALIAIYNEAGGLCRDFSRYEEAEHYYKEAIALIEEMGIMGSESHGTTLINYGTCLGNHEKYDEALEAFSKAASILASLGMGNDYRMAALYNNLSWIAQERENLEDAGEYLNKALFLLKSIPDSEGEQAASYTNLANLYWAQGLLEEAKVTLIKAVKIYEEQQSLRGEGRYAAAVSSLANIYFSEGDYKKCADLCKVALAEIEKEFGKNDAWQIVSDNLAEAEMRLKEA